MRQGIAIEAVTPQIDCGRHPVKRIVGEQVIVHADIFADSHQAVDAELMHRHATEPHWTTTHMTHLNNDRWQAAFTVHLLGTYLYTVSGWLDHFTTWRNSLARKAEAAGDDISQDLLVDLLIGASLVRDARQHAASHDKDYLREFESILEDPQHDPAQRIQAALSNDLALLMRLWNDRPCASQYRQLAVIVDRPKARFSTWYELFPRSAAAEQGQHGTFDDVRHQLPYIASMGFDVLYLPPIHPIGRINRKGPNNQPAADPNSVGSPWAIGSSEGGHKSIHPQLGTFQDFDRLIHAAHEYGIEIALDIAFQCAPDHPYVSQHPQWFRTRPDGSVQHAENPPKKYQDIYPFDFETEDWQSLWDELLSIFTFWIDRGVKIFRVDNPHTKPLPFWNWLVTHLRRDHPDVILLSEAFTRPKVMYHLAKLGFAQSYTYFTWRNTRHELESYFTELTTPPLIDYFRANLWPNTPDILHAFLQHGGRPAFMIRLILAATLGANYGIYGPAFELCQNTPREPGSEEYLHSDKYELRQWDRDRPDTLRPLIALINQARRENPALQNDRTLRFHHTDNDMLICYSKTARSRSTRSATPPIATSPANPAAQKQPHAQPHKTPTNIIITVVNLDPTHTHSGWVQLPLHQLGIPADEPFEVHDLLTDAHYTWQGQWNFVLLNPHVLPAHVFRVHQLTSPPKYPAHP